MYIRHEKDEVFWYMEYIPDDPKERFHYEVAKERLQLIFDATIFWGQSPSPESIYALVKKVAERFPVPQEEIDKYKP